MAAANLHSPFSFRDPAGRVVLRDNRVLRLVGEGGREDYQHLMASGLYEHFTGKGLLVRHQELQLDGWEPVGTWRVLAPERVPFISYAAEWSFSQLQDAALLTLNAHETALAHGMMLKDAPTANVQFLTGRPVLIDTLSFVRAEAGAWPAYYQFCKHFVAPLLLAAHMGMACLRFAAVEPDGIPLELASALLPARSWLNPLALWHVHLHARANARGLAPNQKTEDRRQKTESDEPASSAGAAGAKAPATSHHADPPAGAKAPATKVHHGRQAAVIDSLRRGIAGLRPKAMASAWVQYEEERPTYSPQAWDARMNIVRRVLQDLKPGVVWDLGMATGHFSREAAAAGSFTVGFDADPVCVEKAYVEARQLGETRFLPLVQDLLRPASGGGWAESELLGLSQRGRADLLLALGLTHHLAVRGSVPLALQLAYYARLGRRALVELVPEGDPIVRGWASRFLVRDLTASAFEAAIPPHFTLMEKMPLPDSARVLYLLEAT